MRHKRRLQATELGENRLTAEQRLHADRQRTVPDAQTAQRIVQEKCLFQKQDERFAASVGGQVGLLFQLPQNGRCRFRATTNAEATAFVQMLHVADVVDMYSVSVEMAAVLEPIVGYGGAAGQWIRIIGKRIAGCAWV